MIQLGWKAVPYLIDVKQLRGIVKPCHDKSRYLHYFPILETVYEVKIMCPIPNTKIIGIALASSSSCCVVHHPSRNDILEK